MFLQNWCQWVLFCLPLRKWWNVTGYNVVYDRCYMDVYRVWHWAWQMLCECLQGMTWSVTDAMWMFTGYDMECDRCYVNVYRVWHGVWQMQFDTSTSARTAVPLLWSRWRGGWVYNQEKRDMLVSLLDRRLTASLLLCVWQYINKCNYLLIITMNWSR